MQYANLPFSGLECMQMDCKILVPEDFVLNIVSNSKIRARYSQYTFNDYVDVSRLECEWANIYIPEIIWKVTNYLVNINLLIFKYHTFFILDILPTGFDTTMQ